MGTKLDIPVPQEDVTHQGITAVYFNVPHKLNPLGDDIVFDKDKISITYTVCTFDADLNIINRQNESAFWNDLPQVFKDELKTIYERLVTDAKAKFLIGSGTDEVL